MRQAIVPSSGLLSFAVLYAAAELRPGKGLSEAKACTPFSCEHTHPDYPPAVGTKKLDETETSVVWDLTIPPGVRLPPHEHLYDYSFYVTEGSRLAVFSGEDASYIFEFDSPEGAVMSFVRKGDYMHDVSGALPPFHSVHGVQNIGNTTYKEILFESKPSATIPQLEGQSVRRVMLSKDSLHPVIKASGADVLISGTHVNHESEIKFANGFTDGATFFFPKSSDRIALKKNEVYTKALEGMGEGIVQLDFFVNTVLPPPPPTCSMDSGSYTIKHTVLIGFKLTSPVGELVKGYANLTKKINEMKGFEWGPVSYVIGEDNMAGPYQYAFVTTFDNREGRDAYLVHEVHLAYVEKMVPNIAAFVVYDFKVENQCDEA